VDTGIGKDFRVTFDFIDEIPAPPSGKLQYLVPLRPVPPAEDRLAS
jgi:hypothetical protein